MKRIALKIDVDTYRGTLVGVPALTEQLSKHGTPGTFFFSLGKDSSGKEARGYSLAQYYDRSTRLYGVLFPSPDIGTRCAETLRKVAEAGFETGLHAWNRALWERNIERADNSWVGWQFGEGCKRYAELFGSLPTAYAAPGWRTNRHALRLTQRFGFAYASDCHGSHPFIPVIDGEIVLCPQIPTTLPTIDEILALEPSFSADQAADRILQLSSAIPGDHVFTLRAELEGMKFPSVFARLLAGWVERGYELTGLGALASPLTLDDLPRHEVTFSETAGRRGSRMMQGPEFLAQ